MKTIDRFWSKVDRSGGFDSCWVWRGRKLRGYGKFDYDSKTVFAHRFSYEQNFGKAPIGKCVCHSCDNPSCVNPRHLWIGTNQDNVNDKVKKGRSHGAHKGEKHHKAVLTEAQVLEIINSTKSQSVLAAQFGVHQVNISLIKRGVIWKHLQPQQKLLEK